MCCVKCQAHNTTLAGIISVMVTIAGHYDYQLQYIHTPYKVYSLPCLGCEYSHMSSAPTNTCSTPLVWSESAASKMVIFRSLTSAVEHNQVTAMQPSWTLERCRLSPATPNKFTSLVRSSRVSESHSFCSFSLTGIFSADSLWGVADAGNSFLNWLTVVPVMKCWRCCSYWSTSFLVAALCVVREKLSCV